MSSPLVLDVLGIGFGPANIAVAAALLEKQDPNLKNILFIEKHESFKWHPGMLLPDARMQISFMKDLATLRNPGSPVSFLSYLHSQNRLLRFINRGSTVPTRKEFADYLLWASKYVQREGVSVNFGHEVVSISKNDEQTVRVEARRLSDNSIHTYCARNLVISPGGTPRIPPALSLVLDHPHFAHSSKYALAIPAALESVVGSLSSPRPLSCAVVGSGQSAAEVTINLRDRLCSIPGGAHQVEMIFRKGSMKPSDDTPFSNEIFDPDATDAHFTSPNQTSRDAIRFEYRETNYGVVSPRTIESLYETIYDQQLNLDVARRDSTPLKSTPTIHLRPYTTVLAVEGPSDPSAPGPFTFTLQNVHTRAVHKKEYDIVVAATGYHRSGWAALLQRSELSKVFFQGTGSDVTLIPVSNQDALSLASLDMERSLSKESQSADSDAEPRSDPSTPLTESETQFDSDPETPTPAVLHISRNYRILPLPGHEFAPKIYVQGVEETTHGLSDTLLSVLGVRSGEVVDDMASVSK